MPIVTINAFYLGVRTDMDTNENSLGIENTSNLAGVTFGSALNPIYDDTVRFGMNDTGGDGALWDNGGGRTPENIIYNGVSTGLDSLAQWSVTITYTNGTTAETRMVVVQGVNGRTFLVPSSTGSIYNQALYDKTIRSIRLNSVTTNNYDRLITNRPDISFVCFASDTLIDTENGPKPAGQLGPGHMIRTAQNGFQPLIWCGQRHLSQQTLDTHPQRRPVRIRAGALGNGLPLRDLVVSSQHRIVVSHPDFHALYGNHSVLVAAKHLCARKGIAVDQDMRGVTYVHLLMDRHQIIFGEGTATESLLPGPQALESLPRETYPELYTALSGLPDPSLAPWPSALPILRGKTAALFLPRSKASRGRYLRPLCA